MDFFIIYSRQWTLSDTDRHLLFAAQQIHQGYAGDEELVLVLAHEGTITSGDEGVKGKFR
jgi:hypothetical protein